MELEPVRQTSVPAYPTKLAVEADPALLAAHVPVGWKTGGVAGALAIFLAANLGGCQGKSPPNQAGAGNSSDKAQRPPSETKADAGTARNQALKAVVAPVFAHGEGRGAVGCVVMSPPVFLSEEEALQIIREELTKSGLELSQSKLELKGVTIAPVSGEMVKTATGSYDMRMIEDKDKTQPVTADLADPQRHVAVEFVSAEDTNKLNNPYCGSTVGSYDTRLVAQRIADKVKEKGQGVYFGAFYDPVTIVSESDVARERKVSSGDAWKAAEKRRAEESKTLLRQQVQDFVTWLKMQEVIK
jgi:hypothetical protein